MTSAVKWFNADRGYGFITPNGGGKDVFVHVSALERSGIEGLSEGQTVVLDVVEGRERFGSDESPPDLKLSPQFERRGAAPTGVIARTAHKRRLV